MTADPIVHHVVAMAILPETVGAWGKVLWALVLPAAGLGIIAYEVIYRDPPNIEVLIIGWGLTGAPAARAVSKWLGGQGGPGS